MINVNCICDGISFPFGEATNQRIIMIGKAILLKGNSFRVFVNCKRPRNPLNTNRSGVYENIPFQHLNTSLEIGLPKWKNAIDYYIVGFYNAFKVVRSLGRDKNNIIYLYSQGSLFNAYISFLAFLFKVPVVQEVNEWPEDLDKFENFVYESVMFRWAKGAISISDTITAKINKYKPQGKKINMMLMPILADKNAWAKKNLNGNGHVNGHVNGSINKTFLWCGQVDGYLRDVLLILKAYAKFNAVTPGYKIVICGKYKTSTEAAINKTMAELNLSRDNVVLTGYLSDEMLFEQCKTATGLISPLWNDQRSSARFPTKIASYLFASRPVLTCKMGETGKYLVDKENALFFEPGDYVGLSGLMEFCINEKAIADTIGKQGSALAEAQFDFRRHADRLNDFFESALS